MVSAMEEWNGTFYEDNRGATEPRPHQHANAGGWDCEGCYGEGLTLEGVLRNISVGNNAGQGGWQYYGECQIDDKAGTRHILDYLDIDDVIALNDTHTLDQYERLGLIQIVGR